MISLSGARQQAGSHWLLRLNGEGHGRTDKTTGRKRDAHTKNKQKNRRGKRQTKRQTKQQKEDEPKNRRRNRATNLDTSVYMVRLVEVCYHASCPDTRYLTLVCGLTCALDPRCATTTVLQCGNTASCRQRIDWQYWQLNIEYFWYTITTTVVPPTGTRMIRE